MKKLISLLIIIGLVSCQSAILVPQKPPPQWNALAMTISQKNNDFIVVTSDSLVGHLVYADPMTDKQLNRLSRIKVGETIFVFLPVGSLKYDMIMWHNEIYAVKIWIQP